MSDLNVQIGATITELEAVLNKAKKQFSTLDDSAQKTAKTVSSEFKKSSEGVQFLDNKTNGLASSLVDVADEAKKAGGAMSTALVASGIGAAVIVLGLIIDNWEEIKNLVDDTNLKLQQQVDSLGRISDALSGELKLSKAKEKALKAEGQSTVDILNARRNIIGQIQLQNNELLRSLKAQDLRLDSLASELTLWQKIKIAIGAATGNVVNTNTISGDEAKANAAREKTINDLKIKIEETKIEAIKLNETISGVGAGEAAKPFQTALNSYIAFKNDLAPIGVDIQKILSDSFQIPRRMVSDAEVELGRIINLMNDFNDDLSAVISDQIANTLGDLGQAIGESLASGASVMKSSGDALLGGLGSLLTSVGKMIIGLGVALLAAKTALQSVNPYLAIAGGIALVAAGAAFTSGAKSRGNAIGSSGSGVGGGGSSSSNGSRVIRSSAGAGGGTYVFEIEGTKLVGVLKETINRNRALGGSLGLTS